MSTDDMSTEERLAKLEAENAALHKLNDVMEERARLQRQVQEQLYIIKAQLETLVDRLEARVHQLEEQLATASSPRGKSRHGNSAGRQRSLTHSLRRKSGKKLGR